VQPGRAADHSPLLVSGLGYNGPVTGTLYLFIIIFILILILSCMYFLTIHSHVTYGAETQIIYTKN